MSNGVKVLNALGPLYIMQVFSKLFRHHYLKRIFMQGAADAWEHRGRAGLSQKGDVAQDGGGCWRCFTYEVCDDGDDWVGLGLLLVGLVDS